MLIHLLIVDPQYDFCNNNGSLFVKNADNDMRLLTRFIEQTSNLINDITVTLDNHYPFQIFHPIFWVDDKGLTPEPYTTIKYSDFIDGKFKVSKKEYYDVSKKYLYELEKSGRYNLIIWPYHCIVGSQGATIVHDLERVLLKYQQKRGENINYHIKGWDMFSDQFSAIMAEARYDKKALDINHSLLNKLEKADMVFVAGEALSHCVANTVLDIAKYRNDSLDKFVLLTDTSSPVNGFEKEAIKFIDTAKSLGMKTKTTLEVLDELKDER